MSSKWRLSSSLLAEVVSGQRRITLTWSPSSLLTRITLTWSPSLALSLTSSSHHRYAVSLSLCLQHPHPHHLDLVSLSRIVFGILTRITLTWFPSLALCSASSPDLVSLARTVFGILTRIALVSLARTVFGILTRTTVTVALADVGV